MSLSIEALCAALSESVYDRSALDQPLMLSTISAKSGNLSYFDFSDPSITTALTNANLRAEKFNVAGEDVTLIFSTNGDGFAAEVVKDTNNNPIIAYRGTSNDSEWTSTNIPTGFGYVTSQVTEAIALAQIVQNASSSAMVTLTGHSLGGGLAALASAVTGLTSYTFDPAPWVRAIDTLACQRAASDLVDQGLLPTLPFSVQSMLRTDIMNAMLDAGFTADQIGLFGNTADSIRVSYIANVGASDSVYRLSGEALDYPSDFLNFDGASKTVVDVGFGDPFKLHSEALLALAIARPDFAALTKSDGWIGNGLFGSGSVVSGPIAHGSSDPSDVPASYPGGSSDSGILFRELWLNDGFYSSFMSGFGAVQHGKAGDLTYRGSTDPGNFSWSIHGALVDLGLQVVRDGLQANDLGAVGAAAANVFRNVQNGSEVGSGVNAAVVHLYDINGASPVGKDGITSIADNSLAAASMLSPSWLSSWQTLVVQAGSDDAVMTYAPTGMDVWNHQVVFCGNAGDTVCASGAGDVIFGGMGSDRFVLGNGYNDEIGDDSAGSVVVGGGGADIADYSLCDVRIDVVLDGARQPSTLGSLVRVDALSGIGIVYGSNNDGDSIKANAQFPGLFGGVSVAYELHAGNGNNDILAGGAGNDVIYGASGNDRFLLSAGNDAIDGGGGENTLDLSAAPYAAIPDPNTGLLPHNDGYNVDMIGGTAYGDTVGLTTFVNIQDIVGSAYADIFTAAQSGPEKFDGGLGSDILILPGAWRDYTITSAVDGYDWNFASKTGSAVDEAKNIEAFQFSDVTLAASALLNRAPTLALSSASLSYQQGQSSASQGGSDFSDPDIADMHGWAATLPEGFLGNFSAAITQDTTGGTTGHISWQFSASGADIGYLGAGEHKAETVGLDLYDANNAKSHVDIAIDIVGVNDAPVFTSMAHPSVSERADLLGSQLADTASGVLAFSDAEFSDTHTTSVSWISATVVDSNIQIPSATLVALQSAMSVSLTAAQDSTGTGQGTENWSFSVADNLLDFLGAGQHMTASYNVKVTDNNDAFDTQRVDIDLVGSNDAPVFTGGVPVRSITDLLRDGSGIMIFTDADTIDTHSISGIQLVSGGANGAMGALTATLVHDSTGGATSEIDWAYHLSEVPTSSIQEVWRLSLSDGHGGTATKDVNINIAPNWHPNDYQLPVSAFVNETVIDGQVGGYNTVGYINLSYANPSGPHSQWNFTVTGANADDYTVWGRTLMLKFGEGVAHAGDVVHLVGTAAESNGTPLPAGLMPKIEFDLPIVTESALQYNNNVSQHVVQNHIELAA